MQQQNREIHETAIVAKSAKIGQYTKIGAYASIGPNVVIGDRVEIEAYASVDGWTTVGSDCRVGRYCYLGAPPQHRDYRGEPTTLEIGKNNVFCAYANLSIGTNVGDGKTIVGNDNVFMIGTHVAHDCVIGNGCTFANGATLSGHVKVGDAVVFGGLSGVHQFVQIGTGSMIGAGAIVVKDIFPYVIAQGDRAKVKGINKVGLGRMNFSQTQLAAIKKIYHKVFLEHFTLNDAMAFVETEIDDSSIKNTVLNFLKSSERGLCRG